MTYLDELVTRQKEGESVGIVSICSAHPWVLKSAMLSGISPLLIESTCNQVNQYGGYTGMKPKDFVGFVMRLAEENGYPGKDILLGGDHLGPSVWQDEPSESALKKSERLISDYVKAGFTKIHLDCSMSLGDDAPGPLDRGVSAERAARLARTAERAGDKKELRYVIGTEVPLPGGALAHEEGVSVTDINSIRETIESTKEAFIKEGLENAWERVIAVVVQPGVEYGDDFVIPYQPEKAKELSKFIENHSVIYEAHSTDYQTREALRSLVEDHFAVLKVGPALTFAFREAIFGLAMAEEEILPPEKRSNIIGIMDQVMIDNPVYWRKYYSGTEQEIAHKRKYSLSDRIRYYWSDPEALRGLDQLIESLSQQTLPSELVARYFPEISGEKGEHENQGNLTPAHLILKKINLVLEDYLFACS